MMTTFKPILAEIENALIIAENGNSSVWNEDNLRLLLVDIGNIIGRHTVWSELCEAVQIHIPTVEISYSEVK